jgi:hypothetical protein
MADKILKIGKFGNQKLVKNSLNRLKGQSLNVNSIKGFLVSQNNLVTLKNGIYNRSSNFMKSFLNVFTL